MNGYGINNLSVIIGLVLFLACVPFIGFGIIRCDRNWLDQRLARIIAWCFAVLSVVVVEHFSVNEPSGTRMLLIIIALLWAMKAVVGVEASIESRQRMPLSHWLLFTTSWFGMRPRLFDQIPCRPISDWTDYVRRGLIRIALGGFLVLSAVIVFHRFRFTEFEWRRWIATALLLAGLSLIVHFGIFNLLTGFWRAMGVRCNALFRAPLMSQSLSEFWGQRWNLAFSEMTTLAVFRPLKRALGQNRWAPGLATGAAFLFSGLLHELAISVPVRAGYGYPTLYFALHGLAMLSEFWLTKSRFNFLQFPAAGRIWTTSWVLLPLPILFHRPFLEGCVWPLLG